MIKKIKIMDSNMFQKNHQVFFEDGFVRYHLKKREAEMKTIDYRQIKTMGYETPDRAMDAGPTPKGLLGAVFNTFTAGKSMVSSGKLVFDIYLKDGRFINAVADTETYFAIHRAWLDAKETSQPLPGGEVGPARSGGIAG